MAALMVVLGAPQGLEAEGRGMGQNAASLPNAQRAAPCVACQVFSLEPRQLVALPLALGRLRVALRTEPAAAVPADALAELRRRGGVPVLQFAGIPGPDDLLLAAAVDGFVFAPAPGDFDRLAFDLKRALTAARGQRPSAQLLVAVPADAAAALRTRGLDPYVDAFVDPPSPLRGPEDVLAPVAGDTAVRVLPEDAVAVSAIVTAAAATAEWFPAGLVAAPDRPLTCDTHARIVAYLNAQTLDLVGVSGSCPAPAPVTSDIPGLVAERLDVGSVAAFRVKAGTGDRFAEGVTVGAARALTAEEIVARHQAFAARQAAAVRTDRSTGTLALTFEAPGFAAPIMITSATEIFRDRAAVDLRQRDIRVNGVPFSPKDGVPHLPIIEPERVAAMPLSITLTSLYRYTLEGHESVGGRRCYIVGFRPQTAASGNGARSAKAAALFSGRAWIDERTFAMVRVAATQTGLKGPIVASEQTDTFAPDAEGRWLLARSDIRQTYEGASVRTPIHRLLEITAHEVNAPDFAARRRAAYASTDVILRDTAEGFRYLRREAQPRARSGEAPPEPRSGESGVDLGALRTVAGPVTRIKTLAAGVIVDPNISTPLPFAGLSYVDFDLFHTGTQFSGFFGGSYAQLAFSAPSVRGTRWQLAGRGFAIATSYNDRAFVEGREIYSHDIRQRPAQVAVWALRPVAARAALRLEYDWDYNHFAQGDQTDPAFVIPASQNAHGLRAGLDFQYAGWQTSVWASHTARLGWHAWGVPGSGEDADPHAGFQRFGASVLRTGALSPRVSTRVDASIVSGTHLDRFSRIAFGAFDNRLHGYPSALIRYDRGGVLRAAISWAAAKAVRVDGFADTAAVHDPAFGRGLRNYTGFGAALESPAPFGTLLAAEWGFGVQGVNTNGRTGTHVVRITAYKVF